MNPRSDVRASAPALSAATGVVVVAIAAADRWHTALACAALLSGAITLGALVVLVVSTTPSRAWVRPAATGRTLVRAGTVWTLGAVGAALTASDHRGYWVAAAVAAAGITGAAPWIRNWGTAVLLTGLAVLGTIAPALATPAARGLNGDLGSNAAALFLVALSAWLGVTYAQLGRPSTRYRVVGMACAGVVAGNGVLLAVVLGTWTLGLGVAAVGGLLLGGAHLAGRTPGPVALGGLSLALGAALVLARQPEPTSTLLGYSLPSAPTVTTLLTQWRFDLVLGSAAVLLAVGYLVGVRTMRRRGDAWPVKRTLSWLLGCLVLLLASSSGVNAYGRAMFSVYMIVHMVLNMFAPVLLVLGAPVTLALRTLPTGVGPREWLMGLLHSRLSRFMTNPLVAIVVFLVTLYGVYFTGIFPAAQRHPWGYELLNIHFLMTGYLFYYSVIGVDPGPRRPPFLARLGVLFAIMPFHAFFGIAIMSMTGIIGESFYRGLSLPWVTDLLRDEHTGGAIAWVSGEVPLLLVAVSLLTQWSRQDERQATRSDRHAVSDGDAELADYNAMLAQLSRNRR